MELTLPDYTDASTATRFEELLVEHGFLSTGLVADADDIVGAIQEVAHKVVESVGGFTRRKEAEIEVKEDGIKVPGAVKGVVGSVKKGTGAAADMTGRVGEVVGEKVGAAGGWVGAKLGVDSREGAVKEVVDAGSVLTGGIGEAGRGVAGAVGDAVETGVRKDLGEEPAEVVGDLRGVTGDVGSVAKDLWTGTSVVWQAGVAAGGVGAEEGKEVGREVAREKIRGEAGSEAINESEESQENAGGVELKVDETISKPRTRELV